MGFYTEIYVNVDLKEDTPDDVIQVLKAMCGMLPDEQTEKVLEPYPDRWIMLFSDCSHFTPSTYCKFLNFDTFSNQWSLLGKGDIKNYGGEIEEFFEWIMPYVDAFPGDFIGYQRYEDSSEPYLYHMPGDPIF